MDHESFDPRIPTVYFDKGKEAAQRGDAEAALALFDELAARFAARPELEVRETVAHGLLVKAIVLHKLERYGEEVLTYDEVVQTFGAATEVALRERVADALSLKAELLSDADMSEESAAAYDEIIARFAGDLDPKLQQAVAGAFFRKGELLESERPYEAINVYGELADRFSTATNMEVRELVAMALVNKGLEITRLAQLGTVPASLFIDGLAAFDRVVASFGDDDERNLQFQVAKALRNKGASLVNIGQYESGIEAFDELIDRFEGVREPELREWAARGRHDRELAERLMDG